MNKLTGQILLAGTSQSDADIRYLSNFAAPDPFLFLKTDSTNYLVVSVMEKGRAEKQSKPGTKVFTPAEIGLTRKQSGKMDKQIFVLIKKVKIRRIQVTPNFPVAIFQALKKSGDFITSISLSTSIILPLPSSWGNRMV